MKNRTCQIGHFSHNLFQQPGSFWGQGGWSHIGPYCELQGFSEATWLEALGAHTQMPNPDNRKRMPEPMTSKATKEMSSLQVSQVHLVEVTSETKNQAMKDMPVIKSTTVRWGKTAAHGLELHFARHGVIHSSATGIQSGSVFT